VPELFSSHPDGSLWFVDVDPLLSKRLSLLRTLLAFDQLPDYEDVLRGSGGENPGNPHPSGAQSDAGISVLSAVRTGAAFDPSGLDGVRVSMVPPQALVFLFGYAASLMEAPPPTLASLFAPEVQRAHFGWHWAATCQAGNGVRPTR
jgi:hypothetical protein